MSEHSPQLSSLIESLDPYYASLEFAIAKDCTAQFQSIINEYKDEGIYSLCLYHNGDCTSYFMVSFATESGLTEAAESYLKYDPDQSLEDHRGDLRWSPCDSPYHDDGDYTSMPETDAAVSAVDGVKLEVERAMYADKLSMDASMDVFRKHSQEMHDAAIRALKQVADNAEISAFLASADCLINLNAGDIAWETVSDDMVFLNGQEKTDKLLAM